MVKCSKCPYCAVPIRAFRLASHQKTWFTREVCTWSGVGIPKQWGLGRSGILLALLGNRFMAVSDVNDARSKSDQDWG